MEPSQAEIKELKEDIFFGQVIIIWARWFVVLGVAAVILLNVKEGRDLFLGLIPILVMMLMNFFVHGSYLMEKPIGQGLIMITSIVDIIIISLMVVLGPVGEYFDSQLFVFYYPIVLAFAFIMPRRWAIGYTVITLVLYLVICLFKIDIIDGRELFARLLTLGGMGLLASFYWRIMRRRRRAALGDLDIKK
ncbi:MAG: hypothetical protein JSU58_08815 [Dehalococcoidales bacterium]|nr:MAG: hypothetical protein JSU58_08815 [Dehalococcoidales bacterium]